MIDDLCRSQLIVITLPIILTWLLEDEAHSMRVKYFGETIICFVNPRKIFWCDVNIFSRFELSFICAVPLVWAVKIAVYFVVQNFKRFYRKNNTN